MLLTLADLAAQADPSIRKICADSAHQECCQQQSALVIDVREPHECQQQPVQGSMNIPRGILEAVLPQQVSDPDRPIYLHCATGMRATLAAEQLIKLGYTRISVIQASLADICTTRNTSS